ncbi:MAG TPA: hypothetical protein VNT30_24510 [Stellaceae bacterium]|nr:hypothetical protein [Stellaceae bacterium]
MDDDILERSGLGEGRIDMQRVIVAGHLDELAHLRLGDCSDERSAIADLDSIEISEHGQ